MPISLIQGAKQVVGKLVGYNLEKKETGIRALRYPIEMFDNPNPNKAIPCLNFTFFDTTQFNANALQQSADTGTGMGFKTKGILLMRMPDNGISDNLQFDIAGTSDDFIAEFLRGSISGAQSDGIVGAAKGGLGAVVNELDLNISKKSGAYATNLGSNKTISSEKGVNAFNGVQNRTWTFVWNFAPKTQAEIKEVGNILRYLYQVANVNVTGSQQNYAVMDVPSMLRFEEQVIGEKDAYQRFTPRVKSGWCHIAGLRVERLGDNGYTTFADTAGDAVYTGLELTIKEVTKPTAQLFESMWDDDGKAMWIGSDLSGADMYGEKK
ncbi:baseplate tail-tube junction protein [Aeromonas hydrophila]|uniref:baseplate tail-tube junction protein n=1 Tax=Aeromonas hydrophila TaxID=644 RepID=UPI000CAD0F28|nr:baseplate tail-tube junction protein [Aeromonas hydrophila]PKD25071.1 Tail-tube assembly protein [Aeromonas hydrophila]